MDKKLILVRWINIASRMGGTNIMKLLEKLAQVSASGAI